jgi:excisionase family DNA binding protein
VINRITPALSYPLNGDTLEPPVLPVKPLDSWAVTRAQLAALLQLSEQTIKRMTKLGDLPGVLRFGRSVRYCRKTIEKWIEDGCPRPMKRRARK